MDFKIIHKPKRIFCISIPQIPSLTIIPSNQASLGGCDILLLKEREMMIYKWRENINTQYFLYCLNLAEGDNTSHISILIEHSSRPQQSSVQDFIFCFYIRK